MFRMFRWIFRIDGYVLIAFGLVLWLWHEPPPNRRVVEQIGPETAKAFPIVEPGESLFVNREIRVRTYERISMGEVFGGFLMAFGVVSFAVGHSRNMAFHRKAAGFFLAGHLLLGFLFIADLMSFWPTFAGFILFDLLVWPIPALFYALLPSLFVARRTVEVSTEQEIREAAGQEERNRLAQDLHDSVKQQIYSVQANLATAEARWNDDTAGARSAIEHARRAAREAMAEMSALLDRLRRDPIESVGLVEALRRQCEALGFQTGATVATSFGDLPPSSSLPSGAMTPVFRIAQEALANIARHARAKTVALQLGADAGRNALLLEIRDDGCGFDLPSSSAGMGLRNMRLRAEEIGADLEILSRDGNGSIVRLWLPLIDVNRERIRHHTVRLAAVLIPAIAAATLMIVWQNSAPFLLPFVAVGGSLAAFHLYAVGRLRSA
jgi:signal transduction histidine kinase